MAGQTPRFKFTTFDTASDLLSLHGYKAFGADQVTLDRLLTTAVERHTHTGDMITAVPPVAPTLQLSLAGGVLPPNQSVHYRTSLVDARGQEHIASQTAVAYTPSQLNAPRPPVLVRDTGILPPGDYLYAISAYTDNSESETITSPTVSSNLTEIGGFTVLLPSPPSGATGWNIYRKGPTEYELMHVTTWIEGDGNFLDLGYIAASRSRSIPTVNTSSSNSSIFVDRADGLDAGHTLKIYRTYDPTDWEDSLLVWTASLPYRDTGHPTRTGFPPTASLGAGGAPKVRLGTDTSGSLPPGLTTSTTVINFIFPGLVAAGIGQWQWVNEFDQAVLLSFRTALGRESVPAEQPVLVALERRAVDSDTWLRFQTDSLVDITAAIPVDDTIGPATDVPFLSLPDPRLAPGDALRVAIVQAGGGATPTDTDLSVTVTLAVHHGSPTATYPWET